MNLDLDTLRREITDGRDGIAAAGFDAVTHENDGTLLVAGSAEVLRGLCERVSDRRLTARHGAVQRAEEPGFVDRLKLDEKLGVPAALVFPLLRHTVSVIAKCHHAALRYTRDSLANGTLSGVHLDLRAE
jgi:hypothetical protein